MINLFVNKESLAYHYNTAWTIWFSRDLYKQMRGFINRCRVFADDMIQTEVHLIEYQHFLVLSSHNRAVLVVRLTIINLKASKLWVFYANIDSHHRKRESMGFVCLQGARNCQFICGISVKDVDKFLLFHCANHNSSPFRVCCQIFSWDDSSTSSFPESFLMQLDESLALVIIFKNDYSSRVTAHNQEVLLHPKQPERHYFADDSESFLSEYDLHFPCLFIESEHFKDFSAL
jgi:hypothetical protein